jgi:hypothetical protein
MMTTRAPSLAKSLAVDLPMPVPPPVDGDFALQPHRPFPFPQDRRVAVIEVQKKFDVRSSTFRLLLAKKQAEA